MPKDSTKASELASKLLQARCDWQDAKLALEKTEADYNYAERRLILARQEFNLEIDRIEEDAYSEATYGFEDPDAVWDAIYSVQFVGEPIGSVARAALRRLKKASVARLVAYMRGRGFHFQTDAPARELHGALVKQAWAKKDAKTDSWEYVSEEER